MLESSWHVRMYNMYAYIYIYIPLERYSRTYATTAPRMLALYCPAVRPPYTNIVSTDWADTGMHGYGDMRSTTLTEAPGVGMVVFQNLRKFRVRVSPCYRTH